MNWQHSVLIIFIAVIIIYWYVLKNKKVTNKQNIEGFEDPVDTSNPSLLNWYQNLMGTIEPPIYQSVYDNNEKLAPSLKFNLKIDPLRKEIDKSSGKVYQRLLVPIHLTTTLDGKILAVFNDGKLYLKKELFNDQLWMGPLDNSLYGSQVDGIGMRMIMSFPLNHNQERQIRLLGVGQDNTLYYKETEDIQSKWIKTPTEGTYNNDLVYLFCDFYQSTENYYPLLYGINTNGGIVYKNLEGKNPIPSIEDVDFMKIPFRFTTPPINDNIKVLKIFWDKNGFMIGIGQDLRLYQKKGIDWKVRPWETSEELRGTNPGANTQVIDVFMDNDGRMVGIVLDSESNPPMIKIMKQNQSYYLSDFQDISDISQQRQIFNNQEMIKMKTGLDWVTYFSFEDPDEILYRSNNLQAIYQRSVMLDRFKLRKLCQDRKPTMNLDARNFDLERVIDEKEKKITQLNTELSGLLNYVVK